MLMMPEETQVETVLCFTLDTLVTSCTTAFTLTAVQHLDLDLGHVDASPASIVDVTKHFTITWETFILTINTRGMKPTANSHGSRCYTSHVRSTSMPIYQ